MTFQKGRSGNPGGRPKMPDDLLDLCRRHTDLAIKTLIDICRDKDAPPNARANAANLLLSRAWGKEPAVSIEREPQVVRLAWMDSKNPMNKNKASNPPPTKP